MRSLFVLALLPALTALAAPASSTAAIDAVFAQNVAKGLRLVKTSAETPPAWLTEEDKLELIRANKGFMDVTETWEIRKQLAASKTAAPAAQKVTYPPISQTGAAKPVISTISVPNMQSFLSDLSSLNNRYYKSSTGAQASTLIYNKLVGYAGSRSDISVQYFKHSWTQSSVIARINGSSNTAPATIFGAHLDSINQNSPSTGRAPGSDDDGTGTVNLVEAFRALVAANFKPKSPVEFQFYSGEEGGLLGSQAIATNYKNAGKAVKAMIQLDMTGYFKPGTKEVIALVSDNVDTSLTSYLRNSIIPTYTRLTTGSYTCGYSCSDHASWYDQGYPSALPFEAPKGSDNPNIHTTGDTTSVNGFSWDHSIEYVKLVVGTAYELGYST